MMRLGRITPRKKSIINSWRFIGAQNAIDGCLAGTALGKPNAVRWSACTWLGGFTPIVKIVRTCADGWCRSPLRCKGTLLKRRYSII